MGSGGGSRARTPRRAAPCRTDSSSSHCSWMPSITALIRRAASAGSMSSRTSPASWPARRRIRRTLSRCAVPVGELLVRGMLGVGGLGRDDGVQRGEPARGLVVRHDPFGLLEERVLGGVARRRAHLLVALAQHLGEQLLLVGEVVHQPGGRETHPLGDLAQAIRCGTRCGRTPPVPRRRWPAGAPAPWHSCRAGRAAPPCRPARPRSPLPPVRAGATHRRVTHRCRGRPLTTSSRSPAGASRAAGAAPCHDPRSSPSAYPR